VVAVGTGGVLLATQPDAQVASRFEPLELPRWRESDAFRAFCGLADLVEMTGGIGPDACIDAVGMESHGFSVMDKVKAVVKSVTDETHGLRQVTIACRKGGESPSRVCTGASPTNSR
jgi:hypothetical protein